VGKRAQLEGRRFGKLSVLRFSHIENNHAVWVVHCDCGNKFKATTHDLNGDRVRQCDRCRLKQLWKGNKKVDAAFNQVFAHYRANAKREKRFFRLSKRQFKRLTSSPCFFTGRIPSRTRRSSGGSVYTYNGIDRLNNKKGYTIENCVPCCWEVNQMKGAMALEEFLILCREVVKQHGN